MGQPHNREVEHGDPFRRVFTNGVAQCGCRWTRGPITLPDGSRVGFGDVLHLCPIHEQASAAMDRAHPKAQQRRP